MTKARRFLRFAIPAPVLQFRRRYLEMRRAYRALQAPHPSKCPICSFEGLFDYFGTPPRVGAVCPECGSFERHRLFWLWYRSNASKLRGPVLHFAAEASLEKHLRVNISNYQTADICTAADLKLDIESIELSGSCFGAIICSHVLEHVDDSKALRELHRVLSRTGILIVMVPIVEGWDRTFEDPTIVDPDSRVAHFGQCDHVRYYGRDFRTRLTVAGFGAIEEYTAEGVDVAKYGLLRGEKVFVCSKE